jgi:putative ATP-binding cassette transporter
LGPIDLELRAGQIVILAGGNGSGKTTLVKLLCGLYWPAEGILRVDGCSLREEDLEAYRQLFSVVFADGHLFQDLHGLGGPEVDRRVRDGLEEMELAGKVTIESGRFSTIDLSQGQKRRLALLAALAEDRPVCILDEWAAHQDTVFKEVFYFGLLPALKAAGKAVLVISHDETYFDVADRVLHLREGRILQEQRRSAKGLWSGPLPQGLSR